jgi:hypothetical protein
MGGEFGFKVFTGLLSNTIDVIWCIP